MNTEPKFTTVAEFIEKLQEMPQDAIVAVYKHFRYDEFGYSCGDVELSLYSNHKHRLEVPLNRDLEIIFHPDEKTQYQTEDLSEYNQYVIIE